MKIVIVTKKNKPYVDKIIKLLKKNFSKVYIFDAEEKIDLQKLKNIQPDYIISYISDKIIPLSILKQTKYLNINFHPGPPNYPGFGCYNHALYESSKIYGCTAHIMNKVPDTGPIIDVQRFKITRNDTVSSLSNKTYKQMLLQFELVMKNIILKRKTIYSEERWTRRPFKKKDLDQLCNIDLNMSLIEVRKRIRATYYPNKPTSYINFKGFRFEFKP